MSNIVENCGFCRTVYEIRTLAPDESARCPNCSKPYKRKKEAEWNTVLSFMATAVGALLLVPAFSSPMLTVSDLQHRTPISLIEGVKTLLERGDIFIACVLGFCSGVLPCLKFAGLLLLHSRLLPSSWARHVYDGVKLTGTMGMLDVYFSAVVLFAYQMSHIIDIRVEAGMYAFAAAVACNVFASLYFDPIIYRPDQLTERNLP